jgi:succinoglycan biosynthesis protein ExoM
MTIPDVSVVICTHCRPAMLDRALRAARAQRLPQGLAAEVVVVDNSEDGSAAPVLERAASEPGLPLVHVALPHPNISDARNLGVATARGALIVFHDDDEWSEPDWLAALVETAEQTDADIVFGAVIPDFVDGAPDWQPDGRSYTRRISAPSGTPIGIRHDAALSGRWIGTGNALLRRDTCLSKPAPFDSRLGRSGGEDFDLFLRLSALNRRMVWCAEAPLHEVVSRERASFDYMLERSGRSGRLFSTIMIRSASRPLYAILRNAAVAALQLTIVALGVALAWLRADTSLPTKRLKFAQVAGKLFWWLGAGAHK